jgi:hypothetical protein
MQEIFENVSDKVKEIAEIAWRLAMAQHNPMGAAEFLDNVTNYYDKLLNEEEIEFLRFYFNMKMEMMKE